MKISYKWLKEYIDIDYSVEELESKLTFAGIEVEEVKLLGDDLKQILVAEILEKQKHPTADKLSICQVNDGKETIQVICGAPNCDKGQKVALAPVGAKIGEFKIKKAKLRGEVSFGMLCSEKELGLSEDHHGIMILPEDAVVGQDLASSLGIADSVYDVEITPNRPDLLGMLGVARDLSALLNKKIKLPEFNVNYSGDNITESLQLENRESELCTRYTAKVFKNITIAESPDWLKERLISVGLRPINNVVDVTNYVMMEYGHPLHAFDYDKLDGKKIIIRRAEEGEEFPALDENNYKLTNSDLVIADESKSVALAGIIGGVNSHITENTKNIVLEVANFFYRNIRRSSARLNIVTDSGYRFERNLSDASVGQVSDRAADLILSLTGGTLQNGTLDSYPKHTEKNIVILRSQRVRKILGIEIESDIITNYLSALGLKLLPEQSVGDNLAFEIPKFRRDLNREIDLIEEIIRLHGYNNVPTKLKMQTIMNRESIFSRREIKNILVSHGFSEILNWNFGDPKDLDGLKLSEDHKLRNYIELKNPLGSSFSIMRATLLPSLLKNAVYNINHGSKNIKTFELAKVFSKSDKSLSNEEYFVSGLMIGNLHETHWKRDSEEVEFFDVKGIIEELLDSLSLNNIVYVESEEPYYQKGIGADILFKNEIIGSFGKIDMLVAESFDLQDSVVSFSLNLDLIKRMQQNEVAIFTEIPKFPPVLRDLSFIISKDIQADDIIKEIKKVNLTIIKDVILFDVYEGEHIEKGYRSLSVNLVFSSNKKTLTDDFISKIMKKIISRLQSEFKVKMR